MSGNNTPKRYSHRIEIHFFSGDYDFAPITGKMKISTARDDFELGPSALTIAYQRANPQTADKAFNALRQKALEELWLLHFLVCGSMPRVESVEFESPDSTVIFDDPVTLRIPVSPVTATVPLVSTDCAGSILQSPYKGAIVISMSYLVPSKRSTIDEMERFRYLWIALNPLYRAYSKVKQDREGLVIFLDRLENDGALGAARSIVKGAPPLGSGAWRVGAYITGTTELGLGDGHAFKKPARKLADDTDVDTLAFIMSHQQYVKKFAGVADDPLASKVNSGSSGDGSFFRFVVWHYLYWLRCDTMHGNSSYPLFISDSHRELLNVLNNCVEEIVLQGIKMLAAKPRPLESE